MLIDPSREPSAPAPTPNTEPLLRETTRDVAGLTDVHAVSRVRGITPSPLTQSS